MFMQLPDIIILAGGLGTRLRSEVSDLPKTMASVNGKPFLEYLLLYINNMGFQKVILSTGYMSEVIENHFGNNFKSVNIDYSVEKEPLGTGGAISLALDHVETPYFIVMNGDTFFPINLQRFFQTHVEYLADTTIALREVPDASRYGQVEINDQQIITAFQEKSNNKNVGLINGGTYIIRTKYFKKFELPQKYSFEKDWLQKYVSSENIRGQVFNDYFLDIGIPEDYRRAQSELKPFIENL